MRKLGLSLARGKKKNSKSKPQLGVPKAEKEGVVAELPTMEKTLDQEAWMNEALSIVVAGASGDLAKKKTYPAIFDLFRDNSLAKDTIVVGFARSKMSKAAFDEKLTPWLLKSGTEAEVKAFLEICIYRNGAGYDDGEAMGSISRELRDMHGVGDAEVENRIFYFAIPPNSFLATARNVKANALTGKGFNRVVVEKPFGHSLESAEKLGKDLGEVFTEDYLYRIDHYLGKEMVQNIITLRFGNAFLEPLFNSQHMQCVIITFKESFGTQGRGGYFDSIGIIRDVVQNHLMQLLSILAMEAPTRVAGPGYSNAVRDEKVKVLSAMEPWKVEDCVLGQYEAANGEPGYQDDETVPEGSNCPTYVAVKFFINNRRWSGVPFIIKAGKALDESKVEVRMQFKDSPGANAMFQDQAIPRNELVLRLQPSEAIYMKTNIKKPGLYTAVQGTELNLSYDTRYDDTKIYGAYTRLLLDVLRGKQATFVRKDELLKAWEIVDPLLNAIEKQGIKPEGYAYGSRGPEAADKLVADAGYMRNADYAADWNAKHGK